MVVTHIVMYTRAQRKAHVRGTHVARRARVAPLAALSSAFHWIPKFAPFSLFSNGIPAVAMTPTHRSPLTQRFSTIFLLRTL